MGYTHVGQGHGNVKVYELRWKTLEKRRKPLDDIAYKLEK